MEAKGIRPDDVTYNSIINKHCHGLSQAVDFIKEMEVKGIRPDEVTYTSITNKHCHGLSKALELIKETWTTYITHYNVISVVED